ncbi:MAG: GNAT family N-acetyltransferase [Chloroflexi bacterium]|nr:GNAT family N-acetyltransferase [Chloroflexota bacterium]MCI0895211.1 GNAT family N-acetyltransferase [Chloroflexota bacterium]
MSAGKAWQVRPARATDLPAIEGLLISADGDREVLHQDQFVVSVDIDGVVVGCGRLRPYSDFCELASLAVGSQVRARGMGREIVNGLLERYSGPIYLICEDGVVDFFRRFGFVSILDREMPEGLRAKWDYFADLAGPMNLMLRRENLPAVRCPDDPGSVE